MTPASFGFIVSAVTKCEFVIIYYYRFSTSRFYTNVFILKWNTTKLHFIHFKLLLSNQENIHNIYSVIYYYICYILWGCCWVIYVRWTLVGQFIYRDAYKSEHDVITRWHALYFKSESAPEPFPVTKNKRVITPQALYFLSSTFTDPLLIVD